MCWPVSPIGSARDTWALVILRSYLARCSARGQLLGAIRAQIQDICLVNIHSSQCPDNTLRSNSTLWCSTCCGARDLQLNCQSSRPPNDWLSFVSIYRLPQILAGHLQSTAVFLSIQARMYYLRKRYQMRCVHGCYIIRVKYHFPPGFRLWVFKGSHARRGTSRISGDIEANMGISVAIISSHAEYPR